MYTCLSVIILMSFVLLYYNYKQKKLRYEFFNTIKYYKNNIIFLFNRYNIHYIDLNKDGHGLRLNTTIDGYNSYEIYSLYSNLDAETNAGTKSLNDVIVDLKDWDILEKVTYTYVENNPIYAEDFKKFNFKCS